MANFNSVAGYYEFLKRLVFCRQIDKASKFYLNQIPSNARILIVGGGAGEILENFKASHHILYLELSEAMIIRAKKVKTKASIDFIRKDVLEWTTSSSFDFILTPFVLDCFAEDQLNLIFLKLKKTLSTEGKWIQTDFYPKNRKHEILIKIMYVFFKLTTDLKARELPDFEALFENHHFILERKALFYHSMVETQIYKQID